MANWAVINPGLYHYGFTYPDPPYQNRRYVEELEPFKNVQFKTSVLHNRRIYIGNVKITYGNNGSGAKAMFTDAGLLNFGITASDAKLYKLTFNAYYEGGSSGVYARVYD